jgi:hypothetical protein
MSLNLGWRLILTNLQWRLRPSKQIRVVKP